MAKSLQSNKQQINSMDDNISEYHIGGDSSQVCVSLEGKTQGFRLDNHEEDLLQNIKDSKNLGIHKRHTRSSSSDEDEQRLKNERLFDAVRKKDPEEQIIEEIQRLLYNGAKINAQNARGKTILHISVQKDYKNLVKFLLNCQGIRADISDRDGKTAKDLGSENIIQLFAEYVKSDSSQKMKAKNDINDTEAKKAKISTQEDDVIAKIQGNNQKRQSISTTVENVIPKKRIFLDGLTMLSEGSKLAEHGNIFQLKLLMLCLWRAAHTGENNQPRYQKFRLATEMPKAEKFDDVVFQYQEKNSDKWKFRLIQAKHKENENPSEPLKKITLGELLSTDNKDFSIKKYFYSYIKVQQRCKENSIYSVFSESEIEDVIVITNTDFNSEKERSIFGDPEGIGADALFKTDKADKIVYNIKNIENNKAINSFKIIFENSSDFYILTELLVDHILNNKKIDSTKDKNKKDIFQEYRYPLVNEILKIDDEGKGQAKKYFINLDNFIKGEALSEEAISIRSALIKVMAFRKGSVKIPEIEENFDNSKLPNNEKELNELAKKVAEFVQQKKEFTVNDFEQHHVALALQVLNLETGKLSSKLVKVPFKTGQDELLTLSQFKKCFITALDSRTAKKAKAKDIDKYLSNINIDLSKIHKNFGIAQLSSNERKLKELASKLGEFIKENKKLCVKDFQNDHVVLANEIINIKTQKFHEIFINGHQKINNKVKVLSPEAKKFRRLLLDEFASQDIQITINDQQMTLKKLSEDTSLLTNVLSSSRIEVSKGFAKALALKDDKKIENIDLFAEQMKDLINNSIQDDEQRVIEINDKINLKNGADLKTFNDNIKKLAGYVLINWFGKVRFSTCFLNIKSNKLPGNIGAFRAKLKKILGNDAFESLYEYEFKFDKPFHTCEDGELYRKLPVLHSDEDVNKFFSKLKIIVNYPNRKEIDGLLEPEIKDKFKTLHSEVFQSSFYERLHNWMSDRVGTFYTPAKAKKLFTLIHDRLSLWTIDGFNKPYFADSSQEYEFEKYDILSNFLLGDKQVLSLICKDLFLGHIRIVQAFQELQAADDVDKQQYTRDFGHIFLYLNQLEDPKFSSKIYEVLKKETTKFNLVVIECNIQQQEIEELYNNLKVVINSSSNKKVIFIATKADHALAERFTANQYKSDVHSSNGFHDLTKESQQKLLEQEVIFQGEKVILNKLINQSHENAKEIINPETLVKLIKGKKIIIGSKPLDTSYLEGAYSDIFEAVDIQTFIDKLSLQESNDLYIMSGISGLGKDAKLISSLKKETTDVGRKSKADNLKDCISVFKQQDINQLINESIRIQIPDYQLTEEDFKQICHSNPAKKIYWISQRYKDNGPQYILQQIYNPQFYLEGERFNKQVVIGQEIKEQLVSSVLDEKFVISAKEPHDVEKWLRLYDEKEKEQFEENRRYNKIQFVTSQHYNIEDYFQASIRANAGQTVHLLKFKQGQLIWCDTHGSFKSLSKYRAKYNENIQPLIGENDLIKEIQEKKIVIIAGDPGIGKSTTLTELYESKDEKRNSIVKSHWVIRVNLKNHLEAIRKIDFSNSNIATEFLIQVDASLNGYVPKTFLSMALVKKEFPKPLLIAFDAFDEVIDRDDREKIIFLLKHLNDQTEAKFSITTRLHYEQDLEGELSTFAIRIESMDDEMTRKFIKKHLKDRLSLTLSHDEFKEVFGDSGDDKVNQGTKIWEYTEMFLIKMRKWFQGDVSRFIGTPLQIHLMLGIESLEKSKGAIESFVEWIRNGNGQSPNFDYLGNDIWEIYERFVNSKYNTYFKKVDIKQEQIREQFKVNFDNYNKVLAKSLILQTSSKESLKQFKDIVQSSGIVRSYSKEIDTIEFIHPTFAEYFVAKMLINWIEKWKQESGYALPNYKKQEYLLKRILTESNFKVIRAFLNFKLLKEKIERVQLQEEYMDKNVLFVAAKENNVGIVSFVLNNFKGLDANTKGYLQKSVLEHAAEFGNLEMVEYLVKKGADIYEDSVLFYAVGSRNLKVVEFLVNKVKEVGNVEVYVNTPDSLGRPILQIDTSLEIAQFLVEQGKADVNAQNHNIRSSVLHSAALFNHWDIFQLLVESGADVHAVDDHGRSVLYDVAGSNNLKLVKWLVNDRNADFRAKDKYGSTVLHHAAEFGSLSIVEFLVGRGADVYAVDDDGKSVLHSAAIFGNLEKVKFLVDSGVSVNAKDNKDKSVLHSATDNELNQLDIVKFLIGKGAVVNDITKNKRSALHFASLSGHKEIVEFLLSQGADFTIKDENGATALDLAKQWKYQDIIDSLLQHTQSKTSIIDDRAAQSSLKEEQNL